MHLKNIQKDNICKAEKKKQTCEEANGETPRSITRLSKMHKSELEGQQKKMTLSHRGCGFSRDLSYQSLTEGLH